jgi:hypothetical protein
MKFEATLYRHLNTLEDMEEAVDLLLGFSRKAQEMVDRLQDQITTERMVRDLQDRATMKGNELSDKNLEYLKKLFPDFVVLTRDKDPDGAAVPIKREE